MLKKKYNLYITYGYKLGTLLDIILCTNYTSFLNNQLYYIYSILVYNNNYIHCVIIMFAVYI